MPILPKLCITYESDASSIRVKDDTGAYVLDNNDNGYGGLNTARSDLAGVLQVFYQPYEGDRTLLSTIVDFNATYLATQATESIVSYHLDGWYIYVYTLVNADSSPDVPVAVENLIVYNTTTDDLRQYDAGLVQQVVFDTSILEDGNTYELVIVEELIPTKLKSHKSGLSIEYFECKQCIECGCDDELKVIMYLDQGIRSAMSQFNIAQFEAQRMIEKLTKQFKT